MLQIMMKWNESQLKVIQIQSFSFNLNSLLVSEKAYSGVGAD